MYTPSSVLGSVNMRAKTESRFAIFSAALIPIVKYEK